MFLNNKKFNILMFSDLFCIKYMVTCIGIISDCCQSRTSGIVMKYTWRVYVLVPDIAVAVYKLAFPGLDALVQVDWFAWGVVQARVHTFVEGVRVNGFVRCSRVSFVPLIQLEDTCCIWENDEWSQFSTWTLNNSIIW